MRPIRSLALTRRWAALSLVAILVVACNPAATPRPSATSAPTNTPATSLMPVITPEPSEMATPSASASEDPSSSPETAVVDPSASPEGSGELEPQAYVHYGDDLIKSKTAKARVGGNWGLTGGPYIYGDVRWTIDKNTSPDTIRGEFKTSTYITRVSGTNPQCIRGRITWQRVLLSPVIGYPPSVGVNVSSTSDGWITACRRSDGSMPVIYLNGANYASRALVGVKIEVAHRDCSTCAWVGTANRYES